MVYRSDLETALNWRKASASQDSNDCVEVAAQGPSVLVRDSRNRSAGRRHPRSRSVADSPERHPERGSGRPLSHQTHFPCQSQELSNTTTL
ncbi:DUF397 domain-containing protein [Actinomadura madurae]|nr:DUF397 domain-containing protein [Actinomadura madurae]MCQ0016833.1 DUF397 domain-containing protein [Actinomadura madurae]